MYKCEVGSARLTEANCNSKQTICATEEEEETKLDSEPACKKQKMNLHCK